jgi:hypothetical protein
LEILEKHRGHLRPLVPDSQPTRKLRLLVELRRVRDIEVQSLAVSFFVARNRAYVIR